MDSDVEAAVYNTYLKADKIIEAIPCSKYFTVPVVDRYRLRMGIGHHITIDMRLTIENTMLDHLNGVEFEYE